jgi:hypothetical protein
MANLVESSEDLASEAPSDVSRETLAQSYIDFSKLHIEVRG